MQLLFNLLQLPHQVELSLRAPQVQDAVLVCGGNHPAEAPLRVHFGLYGRGETLGVWCEHPGRADPAGVPIG